MASRARKTRVRRELALLGLGVALAGFGLASWNGAGMIAQEASMLASATVSISAQVPSNPDNTLAQALQEKENALTQREAELQAAPTRSAIDTAAPWGLLSFLMSIALFILVAANFYLDMQRNAPKSRSPFAIDLRNR
ncbi:MAG: hypothetical protein RLZZ342_331 [Candidatus Parcubacteria bacterium]|jgi:predicted PurR-regulated permease PerM